jgi:hypothetical protein
MPIKIEDVVHLEHLRGALDIALTGVNMAIASLNTSIKSAFGEMSFALLTVIDAHNKLEQRLDALERRINDTSKNYEDDSDPLREFLDEACDVSQTAAEVAAGVLYKHYKRWAEHRGIGDRERLSQTMFGRKISERYTKDKNMRGWFYHGLSIRPLWLD